MNIAVIPARGGSKRIPRKNVRNFDGRPMISYAIKAALDSGLFRHVVVSTDDEEIARVALACGAEVPFSRPARLADDYTPTVPVVAHAISEAAKLGWVPDYVCCIYPAVPLLAISDLSEALELLKASQADYSFPIAEFPSAIQRAMKIGHGHRLSSFFPEHEFTRTQDLERAFFDAGQFYWGRRQAWVENPRVHNSAVGLEIQGHRVVDIDTPEDWKRAEILYQSLVLRCERGHPE